MQHAPGLISLAILSTRNPPPGQQTASLGLVLLHCSLVTGLVLYSLFVPLLALLVSKFLELGGNEFGNRSKGGLGILLLDGWANMDRVEEVGTHVALWSVRVLLSLFLFTTSTTKVLIIRRNVVLHILLVTDLVLLGLLVPLLAFLVGKSLEKNRQNAGLSSFSNEKRTKLVIEQKS